MHSICTISLLLLVVVLASSSTTAHNILVLSPITTRSHSNIFRSLVRALAQRDNQVTYWNGLMPDANFANEAAMSNDSIRLLLSPNLDYINSNHQIGFHDRDKPFQLLFDIPWRMAEFCKIIYEDPVFWQLYDSGGTNNNSSSSSSSSDKPYDLAIIDGVFNECVLPLVHKLDVPFVYVSCLTPPPWLLIAVGSPLGFESYPNTGLKLTDDMTFWQRAYNSLAGIMGIYFRHWFVMPVVDRVAKSIIVDYNSTMSMDDIEDKYYSLLITNTHFSINYQQPTAPAVINAGGLHCCSPSRPLEQDLKSFVDGSGDAGFIIVSFGSMLRGANMTADVRRIFMAAFSRLPQRVVWKWENQSRFDDPIPSNVKLLSWLPQQDLLAHPKIRLFITHGGLLSNQEAVYHGVPFISMPVFADQPDNAQKAHDDGYAIRLDWDDLTLKSLSDSIDSVLHNPKYAKRMKQVSALMHDQIDGPLDRAVYWIEYVSRHGGAPHLRSPSRRLALYQRGQVDIILVVFFSLLFAALSINRLVRRLLQFLASNFGSKTTTERVVVVDSYKKLN